MQRLRIFLLLLLIPFLSNQSFGNESKCTTDDFTQREIQELVYTDISDLKKDYCTATKIAGKEENQLEESCGRYARLIKNIMAKEHDSSDSPSCKENIEFIGANNSKKKSLESENANRNSERQTATNIAGTEEAIEEQPQNPITPERKRSIVHDTQNGRSEDTGEASDAKSKIHSPPQHRSKDSSQQATPKERTQVIDLETKTKTTDLDQNDGKILEPPKLMRTFYRPNKPTPATT